MLPIKVPPQRFPKTHPWAIHGLECGITSHASGPPILVFILPFLTQSLPSKNIRLIDCLNDAVRHGNCWSWGLQENVYYLDVQEGNIQWCSKDLHPHPCNNIRLYPVVSYIYMSHLLLALLESRMSPVTP